jgi:hypothetical protein
MVFGPYIMSTERQQTWYLDPMLCPQKDNKQVCVNMVFGPYIMYTERQQTWYLDPILCPQKDNKQVCVNMVFGLYIMSTERQQTSLCKHGIWTLYFRAMVHLNGEAQSECIFSLRPIRLRPRHSCLMLTPNVA